MSTIYENKVRELNITINGLKNQLKKEKVPFYRKAIDSAIIQCTNKIKLLEERINECN